MTQFGPVKRSDRYKFEILKIQDGGGRLEKSKIAVSPQEFDRSLRNLAW